MADAANPRKPLDSYVEIRNWAISMRWLCRAAEAAKSLQLPAVDAAVALFEAKVNVGDVALFRDRLEHADDYAAGLGRNYKRWPDVDFDGWTAAAQALRAAIEQELRPAPKPKT
ncbi:MAG TPA: hypothetical protein VGX27_05555 [Candidatus Dormibacteraeota bacterium]|nr:hypothetical protein [Candidatus Dormibacteraeota bacterium]